MNIKIQIKMNQNYLPFSIAQKQIKTFFSSPSKLRVNRGQICRSYSDDIPCGPDQPILAEAMSPA